MQAAAPFAGAVPRAGLQARRPSKSRLRAVALHPDAHRTSPTRLGNQTCLRTSCSQRSLPPARFRPDAHRTAPSRPARGTAPANGAERLAPGRRSRLPIACRGFEADAECAKGVRSKSRRQERGRTSKECEMQVHFRSSKFAVRSSKLSALGFSAPGYFPLSFATVPSTPFGNWTSAS
jgi:hypothetical protein